jgi:hypothetical protein
MKEQVLTIALVMVLSTLAWGDAFARKGEKKRILVYSGQLLDDQGGPMGGVFPLTFSFHKKARGGTAMWSEAHFVAVDSGAYVVELGRQRVIRRSIDLGQLYVGVRVTKGPQLVRERFIVEGEEPEVFIRRDTTATSSSSSSSTRQGSRTATSNRTSVDYAEKAGFAFAAEKADDATRLGGLTLEQLKRKLGSGSGGSITIGEQPWMSQSKGGVGGTSYELLCPEGYVMTGIRGGSGMYVDRLGIICSKLKSK